MSLSTPPVHLPVHGVSTLPTYPYLPSSPPKGGG
jgi:hypothetical protein